MKAGDTRPKFPRHQTVPELARLRADLARWVRAHFADLRDLAAGEILAAGELNDRAKDNWHPLMVIAHVAGGGWEEHARRASVILSDATGETELLVELLGDVQQVFATEGTDALRSVVLVQKLVAVEGSPWKEQRLSATRLAKMLRPLSIRPRQLWVGDKAKKNTQGYALAQFEDAFKRYPQT